jgi:hypothetical protein
MRGFDMDLVLSIDEFIFSSINASIEHAACLNKWFDLPESATESHLPICSTYLVGQMVANHLSAASVLLIKYPYF